MLAASVPPLKVGDHFVRSGVLLSAANELPIIRDPRAANGVFLLNDVCQRLLVLDSQGGNPLVGHSHEAIKKSLVDLSSRLTVPERINDVLTVEEATTIRPGVRLFRATMDGGDVRQLMVYDLTTDPVDPVELRKFYQREFTVLKGLHSTGLVAEVETPFIWSDNFFIVPIVPLKGQPLSTYTRPGLLKNFPWNFCWRRLALRDWIPFMVKESFIALLGQIRSMSCKVGKIRRSLLQISLLPRISTNSIAASPG